jgi:hypothetical protein
VTVLSAHNKCLCESELSIDIDAPLPYIATNTTNATTTVGALKLFRQQGLLMTAAALG